MPRKKPVVEIRRPPNSEAVADFVAGEENSQTSERSNVRTLERLDVQTSEHSNVQTFGHSDPAIVTRKNGRQRRRTTVYLPPELVQQLKLRCIQEGKELSVVVAVAVERYLRT